MSQPAPVPFPQVDANLLESIREFGRWQEAGSVVEEGGLLLVAGTTNFPAGFANCAARVDPELPASEVLDRSARFFRERERGYTLWIRGEADSDLESEGLERGMREVTDSPWMVLDSPLGAEPPPCDTEIRLVTDEAGVADALRINREAYESLGLPAAETDALYGVLSRVLRPGNLVYVAYVKGEAASTAMVLMTPNVAGIYWVGSRTAARGRGLAAACTRAASNAGFECGARVAALQASVLGEPIYRRLGYRTIARQKWLMALP